MRGLDTLRFQKRGGQFPYWPPSSPQRSGLIPGRQMRMEIEDLAVNQIPRGFLAEVPLSQKPIPRIRMPEQPTAPEDRQIGQVSVPAGQNLFALFMASQAQVGQPAKGGGK